MKFIILIMLSMNIFAFARPIAKDKPGSGIMKTTGPKFFFKKVTYLSNYDGDTIRVNIKAAPPLHPIIGHNIPIRVRGIDTPEMRGKKPCEKVKANEAAEFVRKLMVNADKIELLNAQRGTFFRIIADVKINGVDLGETLLEKNLAVPYGQRPVSWCF